MEKATLGERDAAARSLRLHIDEWEAKAKSATRMLESATDSGAMIAWHTRAQYAKLMGDEWRGRLRELVE